MRSISNDSAESQAYVGFNLVENVGFATVEKLKGEFGSVAAAWANYPNKVARGGGAVDLEGEFRKAERFGVRIVTPADADYPPALRTAPGRPIALYVKGDAKALSKPAIALVGTRRATSYGLSVANRLGFDLAQAGWTVISGLALGIDAESHRGALEAGGTTVGVIGSGLDRFYPEENRGLAREMVAGGGAVVSEFPFGRPPDRETFPIRNHVVAALSRGVVAVEAPVRSGTLITMNIATELGRTVMAVPARVDSRMSSGCLQLIRDGAILVRNADDVLEAMSELLPRGAAKAPATEAAHDTTTPSYSAEEALIMSQIGNDEVSFDDLVGKTGLPAEKINSLAMGLRLRGFVKFLPGNRIVTAFKKFATALLVGWACVSSAFGAVKLENDAMRIDFDGEDRHFRILSIRNKLTDSVYEFAAPENTHRLFSINFRQRNTLDSNLNEATVSERSAFNRIKCKKGKNQLTFLFEGYSFKGEPDALDVKVTVSLDPGKGGSHWTLDYENRSKSLVGISSTFPRLCRILKDGEGDVLQPWSNHGARLMKKHDSKDEDTKCRDAAYLGYKPMVAAFMKEGGGLYIAAEDPQARIKELCFRGEHDLFFYTPLEVKRPPEGKNGNGYPVTIACFKGDWWEVARLYRKWALKQEWTAGGPILSRKDYPRRLCEIPYWINIHSPTPSPEMNAARAQLPDFRIGLHWHQWHTPPHCTDYPEYFPPRPGVVEQVQEVKLLDVEGNLYLDSQLWSVGVGDWERAKAFTAKAFNAYGFHTEIYGNGQVQAVMCPATEFWQKKVQEFSLRCITELKSDSLYEDQTGAAPGRTCYNEAHGHPVGGGNWWYEGYKKMLKPIRDELVKIGGVFTTEGTGEAYMAIYDGFLTVTDLTDEDVPFYNAVYSGYTYYYGSPQKDSDADDSFWAVQANEFLWGQALGWYDREIPTGDKLDMVCRLCKARMQFKDYFAYGQLLDEFRPLSKVDELVFDYIFREKIGEREIPVKHMHKKGLIGAVWKNGRTGKRGVCIVNVAGKPQRTLFDFPTGVKHMKVVKIEGEPAPLYAEKKGRCAIQLPPRTICFLEESENSH